MDNLLSTVIRQWNLISMFNTSDEIIGQAGQNVTSQKGRRKHTPNKLF